MAGAMGGGPSLSVWASWRERDSQMMAGMGPSRHETSGLQQTWGATHHHGETTTLFLP